MANQVSTLVPRKREKTIKSETRKVFLVIFAVLFVVGLFSVVATYRGYQTFNEIKGTQIPQFQSSESLKQKALEIIGIFYLLAGETDVNLQMEQMYKYDALAASFNENLKSLKDSGKKLDTVEASKKLDELTTKTEQLFLTMNQNAREMTIANMTGKRSEGKKFFELIVQDVANFKSLVDEIETLVMGHLDQATAAAQSSLRNSSVIGVLTTISAIFIALGLIRYLMSFLSVTLLPISNLMHNLRQAVFSINKNLKVISPVSRYSEKVFEKDIVGEDVFELIFNALGQKSEAFSSVTTTVKTVFGEDSLQWSLMEDSLPPLVSRRDAAGNEKILKLTYTPLMKEDDTVQDIMIVAEDVTELEKAKREASAKQAEVLVIQGLIGIDREDLESFLADTLSGVAQCYSLIGTLENDIESRKLLFRILHTIKGNSRLYNLSTISEVVHAAENSVVEINNRLDNKDPVGTEFYAQLTKGLRKIEAVVSEHNKVAAQLFGIADASADGREEFLHQNFLMVEQSVQKNDPVIFDQVKVSAAGLKTQFVLSNLGSTVSECLENCLLAAKHLAAQELIDELVSLLAAAKANELSKQEQLVKAREIYFRTFFQSPRKSKYSLSADDFFEPLQKLLQIQKVVGSYKSQEVDWSSMKMQLEQPLLDFYNACDKQKFLKLRFASQKIAQALAMENQVELDLALSSAWVDVGMIWHIDASFSLEESEIVQTQKAVSARLANAGVAQEVSDMRSALVTELLGMHQQLGVSTSQVVGFVSASMNLSESATVEWICGRPSSKFELERAFNLIKDGLSTESNIQLYQNLLSESSSAGVKSVCQQALQSASLRVDLYKILANFLQDQSLVKEEASEQNYEVSAQWYDQLSELVEKLPSVGTQKAVADQMLDLVASVFDYPIKTLCSKMEPMVRDISKRLGKNINYVVSGDPVAMPRELAYALRDALVHMLRNSLDHGIEMPQTRANKSKADVATIEISCKNVGDWISIQVKDDGAGINVDKVVAKALDMKMISADKGQQMSLKEKQELIFLSRLSTKEEVSSLSGRGVGMDAVKSIVIDRMQGRIQLESDFGKGTVFTIEVPRPKHRSVVSRGLSEVAAFLIEAKTQMQTASPLVGALMTEADAGKKLFRVLHTIKASATMHNLKGLSDLIHFCESIVSNVIQSVEKKHPVDVAVIDKLKINLSKTLEAIESQLKIHKRGSKMGQQSERDLFMTEAAQLLDECQGLVAQVAQNPEAGRKLFQILHTMKSNAQMHKVPGLAEIIHSVESTVSNVNNKLASQQAVLDQEIQSLDLGNRSIKKELEKHIKKAA